MKRKNFGLILISAFLLFCAGCSPDGGTPENKVILPDDTEQIIYDCKYDSGYHLFADEQGYDSFELPIYSNFELDADDLAIVSFDGNHTENIELSIASLTHADIPISHQNVSYDKAYVENVLTIKVSLRETGSTDIDAIIDSVSFRYRESEFRCEISASVFSLDVSAARPEPLNIDGTIDLTYSDREIEALTFAGNPSSALILKSCSLLGHDWLSLTKSKWQGKSGTEPVIVGELDEAIVFDEEQFSVLETYFYFMYRTEVCSPWYSDYLMMNVTAENADYSLAFKIKSYIDIDDYYMDIFEQLFVK